MNFWKGKHGPLLIAEIGGNHQGNFNYAKKLTRMAIESGVDVVKFQLYSGDGIVNKKISPERNKHFKKFELSKQQHIELAKMCINAGAQYSASIWDLEMIDWMDTTGKDYGEEQSGTSNLVDALDTITWWATYSFFHLDENPVRSAYLE